MTRWLNCKHSVIGILNTRTLLCVQPLGWVCLPFRSAQLDSALIGNYDIFNRQTINISHHIYPLVVTRCSKPSAYIPGVYSETSRVFRGIE
jgi:hypothetical protein